MENVMTRGFTELNENDLMYVDGGGWKEFGYALSGGLIIAGSLPAGVATGIGASVVGTPVIGVAAGVATTSGLIAIGCSLLDKACADCE